jgi:hypothetical protein
MAAMKLEDFAKVVHMEVEKFADKWKKESRKNAALWPKEMPEGDWWEQLVAHLGNTGKTSQSE